MAKPIQPTPILDGEDAKQFLQQTNNVRYSAEKEQFLKECDEVYQSTQKK